MNWSLLGTFLKRQNMHVYTYKMNIYLNPRYYIMLKIKMDKTPKQVRKILKETKSGKNLHETNMKRLKKRYNKR